MGWIADHGLLLSNYFAGKLCTGYKPAVVCCPGQHLLVVYILTSATVTHPSQPNYAAAVGGDHFGMDHDEFISIPANVSTVVDLLDTRGISWGEYMEDLPYAGYDGMNFSNQATLEDDYVRKHNPLMLYDSVAHNATRARQIKNFTGFADDLDARRIPQWSFVTPNMVRLACSWPVVDMLS